MDVAALALSVDSSSVVKAANDLERFSTVSEKAAASGKKINLDGASGSIAKLVASVQSIDSKLGAIVSAMAKLSAANDNVAASSKAASTALNTLSGSFRTATAPMAAMGAASVTVAVNIDRLSQAAQQADAHVVAFRMQMASASPVLQQADAHVVAYRNALSQIPQAANNASVGVAASAGAIKANTGNIAAQFQDIGVTAFMGMNPLLIALQQGTQLSAVFAQSGASLGSTLAGAFRQVLSPASLLTIGIVALVAVLIQYGMEALNSADKTSKLEKAIKDTQITTYALGDAQTALSNVFDLTTGKIKTQSEALRGLARAQLEVIRVTAIKDQAEARKTIAEGRGRNTPGIANAAGVPSMTGIGLTGRTSANVNQRIIDLFTSGKITSTQAIDGMERLRKAGKLTEEQFIKLTGAVASFGVAGENMKIYDDARAALNGDKGALQQFLNLPKPRKTPKGPKTDAEKLADIYTAANADIAAEKARALAEANQLSATEAAKLEKQTALLNSIQQKGIPITDAIRKKVGELADEYARVKIDADVSKVINDSTAGIERQRQAIEDETKLIGLYGDAYARARREMEAQRALRAALPRGEIAIVPNLTSDLSDAAEAQGRAMRAEKLRKESVDAAYAMDRERAAISLTGAAAIQYAYVTERLVEAKRQGIALSPAEVSAIEAAGDAYAAQRHAIDEYRRNIEDARESVKGFFSDWIGGAMRGEGAIKAFGQATMNVLNRIIDRLLNSVLDRFLDSAFSSISFGGQRNAYGVEGTDGVYAKGGTFGTARRFAQGGAFTNQIVTSPTLFRFAKGSALGEMGEAGPEAIMPLKRGPNGSLGVQMHGGGRSPIRMGDVYNHFQVTGAFDRDQVLGLIRQGGVATYDQVKRDLQSLLTEIDQNGAVAS